MHLQGVRARTQFLVASFLCFVLTGCSSYGLISAAPEQSRPVVVEFTEGQLLGWTEVPANAYFVPESQLIIVNQPEQVSNVPDTGRPGWVSATMAAAVLMGGGGTGGMVLGGTGKINLEGMEEAARINLTSLATHMTREIINTNQFADFFVTSKAPSLPVLSVFTTVILTYVNDSDAIPFILLKASLSDSSGKSEVWATRYFVSSGKPLPVTGKGSWAELGSAGIESALAPDLKRSINFMLSDISSPKVRNDNELYMIQSRFPYLKGRIQIVGHILDEDSQSIYFAPKIDDSMAFSGIHILDKSVTKYRKAIKGDGGIAGFRVPKERD